MSIKNQTYLTMTVVLFAATAVVVVIIYWTNMKQAIKGAITKNYFSDSELKYSTTAKKLGLNNEPTKEAWENLYALRDNILNPSRELYGSCVYVNCAYRSPEVNAAVGGEESSQHKTGQAADITTKSIDGNRRLFAILATMPFDQLIWEKGGQWIHVSYDPSRNRRVILSWNGSSYKNITGNWQSAIA